MFHRFSLTLAIITTLATPLIQAQEPTANQTAPVFWKAKLPGGNYMVALNSITSISHHQYIIDSSLIVSEVTIDTTGNSLVRFYSISPMGEGNDLNPAENLLNRGKELIDQSSEKTGINVNETVIKQYPTTTHAKTVEFRLSSKQNIEQLYKSIAQSWERGRRGNFSIQ